MRVSFLESMRQRIYLSLYPIIRPHIGRRRRKSQVRFAVERENLFRANDPKFEGGIWFYSTSRARLYFRPEGILGRLEELAQRYQDEPVILEPNDRVVDVGANIGEFSIGAARNSNVLAFEPDPFVITCLQHNAENRRVKVFNVALADKESEMTFYLASHSADSSIIRPRNFSDRIKVKAVRLDDVLRREGIVDIDFLKVEAEGAEPEVLLGSIQTLARTRKVAVDVSAERLGQSPWREVSEILSRSGFTVWRKRNIAFGYREKE